MREITLKLTSAEISDLRTTLLFAQCSLPPSPGFAQAFEQLEAKLFRAALAERLESLGQKKPGADE